MVGVRVEEFPGEGKNRRFGGSESEEEVGGQREREGGWLVRWSNGGDGDGLGGWGGWEEQQPAAEPGVKRRSVGNPSSRFVSACEEHKRVSGGGGASGESDDGGGCGGGCCWKERAGGQGCCCGGARAGTTPTCRGVAVCGCNEPVVVAAGRLHGCPPRRCQRYNYPLLRLRARQHGAATATDIHNVVSMRHDVVMCVDSYMCISNGEYVLCTHITHKCLHIYIHSQDIHAYISRGRRLPSIVIQPRGAGTEGPARMFEPARAQHTA